MMDVESPARSNATKLPPAAATAGPFRLLALSAEAHEFCHMLAMNNMSPYLIRRQQQWDEAAWRAGVKIREFLGIYAQQQLIGFLSLREADDPIGLHVSDLQLLPEHRNIGAGGATLDMCDSIAQGRRKSELTLNVFRDNPAVRLYERHGYKLIGSEFDKYKMRKTLLRPSRLSNQASNRE